jgi:hypothetical protein
MIETVTSKRLRLLATALLALAASPLVAIAQQPAPAYPGAAPRNPVCIRLEAQLATLDRGIVDPATADQIKRLQDSAARQQADLDRVTAQSQRLGCQGRGFFSLFSGQPQQCGPVTDQMQQMRANLDRTLGEIQNLQGNNGDREGPRRNILGSLAQNDCGPQYRAYANRGFFETLFGPPPTNAATAPDAPLGNTYRTLCVRTCDGYYFPISYSTVPSKFADDEKICHAMCPASETVLYSHRNPGEDISQAVSSTGRNYTELPTAFAYRKAVNPSCSCRAAGQTWADALKQFDDTTVEPGDIIVNEERAKILSQPQTDAQGKPIKPSARAGAQPKTTAATPAPIAAVDKPAETEPGKRKVRMVGPKFLPEH